MNNLKFYMVEGFCLLGLIVLLLFTSRTVGVVEHVDCYDSHGNVIDGLICTTMKGGGYDYFLMGVLFLFIFMILFGLHHLVN